MFKTSLGEFLISNVIYLLIFSGSSRLVASASYWPVAPDHHQLKRLRRDEHGGAFCNTWGRVDGRQTAELSNHIPYSMSYRKPKYSQHFITSGAIRSRQDTRLLSSHTPCTMTYIKYIGRQKVDVGGSVSLPLKGKLVYGATCCTPKQVTSSLY